MERRSLRLKSLATANRAPNWRGRDWSTSRRAARMVWVIDPDAELVVVLTAPDHMKNDTLDAGELLPGFTCAVAELFE